MTSSTQIFFDTDCISAFLWTDRGSIIEQLYSGRVVFPQTVIDELKRAPESKLLERCKKLEESGCAQVWDIDSSSPAFRPYIEMAENTRHAIGKGEAAALALAKVNNGIIASNNLRDIMYYIKEYNLSHITTGTIMVRAYEEGLLSMKEADGIWADMLAHGRKLGASSFTEYYNTQPDSPVAW